MIDGLTVTRLEQTDLLTEVSLAASGGSDGDESLALTVVLVVGPADPNALAYLVPRAVFARGHPVHVGALLQTDDHAERMLEILEVMDANDIVVFLCENPQTITTALDCLGATPHRT